MIGLGLSLNLRRWHRCLRRGRRVRGRGLNLSLNLSLWGQALGGQALGGKGVGRQFRGRERVLGLVQLCFQGGDLSQQLFYRDKLADARPTCTRTWTWIWIWIWILGRCSGGGGGHGRLSLTQLRRRGVMQGSLWRALKVVHLFVIKAQRVQERIRVKGVFQDRHIVAKGSGLCGQGRGVGGCGLKRSLLRGLKGGRGAGLDMGHGAKGIVFKGLLGNGAVLRRGPLGHHGWGPKLGSRKRILRRIGGLSRVGGGLRGWGLRRGWMGVQA